MGDALCIVRDLETIIVLVLLAFKFIPQMTHHSLTLLRSPIRDSAAATLTPGDGTIYCHQSGVIRITDQLIFHNRKKLQSVRKEQCDCSSQFTSALFITIHISVVHHHNSHQRW